MIIQVIDALEYIHKRGYIHNDIAPRNIMISNSLEGPRMLPRAILIDFGAANILGILFLSLTIISKCVCVLTY